MTQGLFDVPFEAGLPFSQVSLIVIGRNWLTFSQCGQTNNNCKSSDSPCPTNFNSNSTFKEVPQIKLKLASSLVIKHSVPIVELTDSMVEVTKNQHCFLQILQVMMLGYYNLQMVRKLGLAIASMQLANSNSKFASWISLITTSTALLVPWLG